MPAPIISIREIALLIAATGSAGSAPRSKRMLASVLSPSFLLVRRTEAGLKYALSRTMVVVAFVTSVSAPPMTPATATARSASAMTSMSGESTRVLTIERLKRFAGPRGSHANVRAGQSREIERVHRMAHLEQHIVGDVDDVADRPDAGGVQARLHPFRRGTDRDGRDRSDVAGTEVRVLDDDLEIGGSASGA